MTRCGERETHGAVIDSAQATRIVESWKIEKVGKFWYFPSLPEVVNPKH
jgi:hypothetical protein